MDFQRLASSESSVLVDRLLQEHRAASLRQIQILREALDAAAHEIAAPSDSTPLVKAFTDRLSAAVASEVARIREEAAATIGGIEARLEAECARTTQLDTALAEAGTHASHVEAELQAARAQIEGVRQETAARVAEAAAERERSRREIEQLTAALAEAKDVAARLSGDVEAERRRADTAEREGAARAAQAAAQDEETRTAIERLRTALADAEQQAAQFAAAFQAERERADAADQDLAVTIEAHGELEAALRQAETAARHAAQERIALETELASSRVAIEGAASEAAALRDGLDQSAAAVAMLERQLADAQSAGADRDALAVELDARGARIEALEDAARRADAQARDLDSRLQEAAQVQARLTDDVASRDLALEREQAAVREARADLEAASARIAALEAEIGRLAGAAQGAHDDLSAQLDAALARARELEAAHAAQDDRLAGLQAQLDTSLTRARELETAHGAQAEQIAGLQAQLTHAQAEQARLRAQADGADTDRTTLEALRGDVDRVAALFDASVRGLRDMAAATTAGGLLTGLLKRLSIQFARVALFRVKGDRLTGEQQIGFDEAVDITTHVLPLQGDSLLARAARSGAREILTGSDAAGAGLPPGGTLTLAVALPIVLHGVPIAVAYADDAGVPDAARGPAVHEGSLAFAEILVGHAVALLVRHTHELKTLAELRDYATTLLQEAQAMYLADVDAGKTGDALRAGLKDNIDYASQLYAYRAAMEGTAAAALFDERMAEEGSADTPFGRDLATLLEGCESLILNQG